MLGQGSPPPMQSPAIVCSVCGEPLEPHTTAYCDACGEPYHLNQRSDLPGKDCGQVWINEEFLSLQFACDTCLHPAPAPEALDEILDSAEAALLANIDEDDLLRAADSGTLHHRKTRAGVYLFDRDDVVAFTKAGQ